MKFISLKENLKKGLLIVGHLSFKNINLPILNNILIKAKKEGLELVSTNLDLSIKHFLRAKTEKEGNILVDAKIINEYINLLPEEKIETELVGSDLKIKCQNYKTKINTQESKDFPLVPKIDEENCFFINTLEFKKALNSVLFAVSNNENRLELSGVYFNFLDNKLFLVSTDSYRLVEKKIDIKTKENLNDKNIIVPAKTLQEIVRILGNFKDGEQLEDLKEIKICFNENQILFSFASTEISSRLIIGSYPDYKQIIPNKESSSVFIDKDVLLKSIKTAGLFSKTGINDITVSVKKNKLIIFSSSSQVGENFISLDCKTKGSEIDIIINYRYFLDGLNNISCDNLFLYFIDENHPCKIIPENDDSFLYIVMPIKQ